MKKTFLIWMGFMMLLGFFNENQAQEVPYHWTPQELDQQLNVQKDENPSEFLRVVYFHRNPGCSSCQKMAKMLYSTIQTEFAQEAEQKKIVLRYMDFEKPENAVIVKTLKIQSSTLILFQIRDGRTIRARKLTQIWALCGDKTQFQQYISSEIHSFINEQQEQEEPE